MKGYLKPLLTFLLVWAFAGLGFRIRLRAIAKMGARAFIGGLLVAILSSLTGLILIRALWLA